MGLEVQTSKDKTESVIQKCIILWIVSSNDLEEDIVYKHLFGACNLSTVQLETLIIDLSSQGSSLNDKIQKRRRLSLTKGSYLRTLKQAQNNIEQSVYTIILLQYLNLVNEEAPSNLLRIGTMLQQLSGGEISKDKSGLLMDRIQDIVETLSGKRFSSYVM